MSSSLLRRSRARELDDEDNSRQSTPASTAPHDAKRARRSLTLSDDGDNDNEDDDEVPTPESENVPLEATLQRDRKPVILNGNHQQKPIHQPGAIVRVKLTDFVTYTSAEFFPGPNLNMVIGPNGTGKSTLVCAICLGLGWGTQYLGRAKDAADFVKHGCREATIEIELQRITSGRNATKYNPIITRTIKREGNKSSYTMNGRTASGKAVMELARSFDIQIDNLCQFLPQDKVVEFAQMTPIEILQSTQRAAAPPEMLEHHEQLKCLRAQQKVANNNTDIDRKAIANLEHRQEMQRTEVERMRERAVVQKKLGYLQRCKPIANYSEALTRAREAKTKQKETSADLKRFREEATPTLKKLQKQQNYYRAIKDRHTNTGKDVDNALKECNRLSKIVDDHVSMVSDLDRMNEAEKNSMKKPREEMARTRGIITMLKKQKEVVPEEFDPRAINQEISDGNARVREIDSQVLDMRQETRQLNDQRADCVNKCQRLKLNLKALNTQIGRQEDLLKSRSSDSHQAWSWIKDNRGLFEKEVFGPPMISCSLKDPSMAGSVESVLQQNDFRIFTAQCPADFKRLQAELNDRKQLHDLSLRVCPFETLERFNSPLSPEQMKRYGLKGWAIDYLDGPPAVLAMLCQEKFLHQTAITDTDISQAQHDQLAALPAVKGYVSKTKVYTFVRRTEYGAAGIHARERATRNAEIWTDRPLDSGRTQLMEREIRELTGECHELQSQITERMAMFGKLDEERTAINTRIEGLRSEKEQKQKALVAYQGLDTKIASAEQKIVELQEVIVLTNERIAENQGKRDVAMFAKAEAVLEFCTAVHAVREKRKAHLEHSIAVIQAENDMTILQQRNERVLAMIKAKEDEEKSAKETARAEDARAKSLKVEVIQLRDEAAALEEEGDNVFNDIIKQVTEVERPTESHIDTLIEIEEAKLELTAGGNDSLIKEFEDRAAKIESHRSRLTKTIAEQQDILHRIRNIRGQWEQPLDALIAKISDSFGESFARIGCAGQVVVHKASSDDPVDCLEELGGSDNGLDFANWAIHISVKFRENEGLSLLDSHRQSGGERAVSTIFYLMALQSLSRAPFRVVDEINQGMDPRNERMVHGRMVDIAAADERDGGQGSQYFLVTPKLLSGLKYKAGMTVLCIVSGENMPSAGATKVKDGNGQWMIVPGKKIDFAAFAQTARRLGLNSSARRRVDSGVAMNQPLDSFGITGRSQASIGA